MGVITYSCHYLKLNHCYQVQVLNEMITKSVNALWWFFCFVFCILTYAIIYIYICLDTSYLFRLYLYSLNIVLYFFKYFCTNIFHRRNLYTFYNISDGVSTCWCVNFFGGNIPYSPQLATEDNMVCFKPVCVQNSHRPLLWWFPVCNLGNRHNTEEWYNHTYWKALVAKGKSLPILKCHFHIHDKVLHP